MSGEKMDDPILFHACLDSSTAVHYDPTDSRLGERIFIIDHAQIRNDGRVLIDNNKLLEDLAKGCGYVRETTPEIFQKNVRYLSPEFLEHEYLVALFGGGERGKEALVMMSEMLSKNLQFRCRGVYLDMFKQIDSHRYATFDYPSRSRGTWRENNPFKNKYQTSMWVHTNNTPAQGFTVMYNAGPMGGDTFGVIVERIHNDITKNPSC